MRRKQDKPSISDSLSTKEKLIEVGIHLFSKNGFEGTTTRMLADAIGANNAVIYFHFKSKENLYAEVLNTVAERAKTFFAPLQQEIIEKRGDKPFTPDVSWKYISRYIDLYIAFLQDTSKKEELYLLLREELSPANGQRPIAEVICNEIEHIFRQLLMDYWQSDNDQMVAIAVRLITNSFIALSDHSSFMKMTLNISLENDLPQNVWDDIKNFALNSIQSYKEAI